MLVGADVADADEAAADDEAAALEADDAELPEAELAEAELADPELADPELADAELADAELPVIVDMVEPEAEEPLTLALALPVDVARRAVPTPVAPETAKGGEKLRFCAGLVSSMISMV